MSLPILPMLPMKDPGTESPRKQQAQDELVRMGIDSAYISTLVNSFYKRLRNDQTIAPVFEAAIGERWDDHLGKMKRFWESVVLNKAGYSGNPIQMHQKLNQAEPRHFQVWLALFRKTLDETAPTEEAIHFFAQRAQRIAQRLHEAMFGFGLQHRPSETAAGD